MNLPPVPEGYRREWVEDDYWRLSTPEERRRYGCRWGAGFHSQACGAEPVAAFNRGRWTKNGHRMAWWHYCERHLYGRRIVDGVVYHQRIVEDR